jgi:hypothetical protein
VKPEKPFYLSTAHDRRTVQETLDKFGEALGEIG